MSSVNSILDSHGKTPKDPKETARAAKELTETLTQEGMVPDPKPPKTPPPRGRGRPAGSKSKSPGPRTVPPPIESELPSVTGNKKSPEQIANQMKCKRLIRKLRAYKRNFPELLAEDLSQVNPHFCTYEQLVALIESCKEVIGDEIESMSAPDIVGSVLDKVEQAAMFAALSSEPGSTGAKMVHLRNFARVAKEDPCIAMDLKLIACEMVGFIPQNPFMRLFMNLARCALDVAQRNATAAALNMHDAQQNPERFSDF